MRTDGVFSLNAQGHSIIARIGIAKEPTNETFYQFVCIAVIDPGKTSLRLTIRSDYFASDRIQ